MAATDIQLDAPSATEPEPEIAEGRGWRRTTPCPETGHRSRCYEDTAPSCDIAEATDVHFTRSVSEIKRRGVPTDWTGPAKWNTARGILDDWAEVERLRQEHLRAHAAYVRSEGDDEAARRADETKRDLERHMAAFADITLNEAADRGSAIHRAIEAILAGRAVDYDDLRRNGALAYVAAMHSFTRACDPQPELVEIVCFDRENLVAGTADLVGTIVVDGTRTGRWVVDYKTRTSSQHDRRPAEAVQLGAYAHMLTAGYYMDAAGRRRRLDGLDGAAIVTLGPDGTWQVHRVDLERAIAGYHRAIDVCATNLVSHYYDKAVKGEPLDIGTVVAERLGSIERGTPEFAALTQAWNAHGLPRRVDGTWQPPFTTEDWAVADELLTRAEPFAGPNPAPATFATDTEIRDVATRLAGLPEDLRSDVVRAATGMAPLDGAIVTTDDLEEWDRLVAFAEGAVEARRVELGIVLDQLADDQVGRTAVLNALPQLGEVGRWQDCDIERCAEVVDAYLAGDLIVRNGTELIVSPRVVESLEKNPTKAKARQIAPTIGRPAPTRFDAVMADVVLYAAVRAA